MLLALNFRKIAGEDVDRLHALVLELIGIDFPQEYFSTATSYGAFDSHDRLVGGFLVQKNGSLRTLQSIPQDVAVSYPPDFFGAVAEINAFCLEEQYRTGRNMVSMLQMLAEAMVESQAKYGAFSVDLESPELLSCYRRSGSQALYQGLTVQLPGMTEPALETVEYFEVRTFIKTFSNRYNSNRKTRVQSQGYHDSVRFTKAARGAV